VFRVAGTLVLSGLLLGYFMSPYWLLLSAFVGVNLLQASFTGFCPLTRILKRLKLTPCSQGSPLA
jgi:hypothetical protein